MSVTVSIPTILRPLTGDQKRVPADGATLSAVIDDLETRHAGIRDRLIADGALHRFVNVYVDDEEDYYRSNHRTLYRNKLIP